MGLSKEVQIADISDGNPSNMLIEAAARNSEQKGYHLTLAKSSTDATCLHGNIFYYVPSKEDLLWSLWLERNLVGLRRSFAG